MLHFPISYKIAFQKIASIYNLLEWNILSLSPKPTGICFHFSVNYADPRNQELQTALERRTHPRVPYSMEPCWQPSRKSVVINTCLLALKQLCWIMWQQTRGEGEVGGEHECERKVAGKWRNPKIIDQDLFSQNSFFRTNFLKSVLEPWFL